MTDFATLEEIDSFAGEQPGAYCVPDLPLRSGGVDPLGLRQLNFDLMDRCIPGLNNAAWRLRPYAVVAWAWWWAAELAEKAGISEPPVDLLKSFVDRIEVLFAAGHLLAGEFIGLPGRDTLNSQVAGRDGYDFSSEDWPSFRRSRRDTVSIMAPVAYGPSAKVGLGLGYLAVVKGAFAPVQEVMPAVIALHQRLTPVLKHPAFGSLQCGWVSAEEMGEWQRLWRMDDLSDEEVAVGRERLVGARAPERAETVRLMRELLGLSGSPLDADELRRRAAMAPGPVAGDPAAVSWRALQVRQLLRIGLEGLLNWTLSQASTPCPLPLLVERLRVCLGASTDLRFGDWLEAPCQADGVPDGLADPVGLIRAIQLSQQADDPTLCATGIRAAVQICRQMGASSRFSGQSDRLPLSRVSARFAATADLPVSDGLAMLVSEWIIGQHVYWAVGRSGDDTQRLRIILEEEGWISLVARPGNADPTPDRLFTLLELCADCRLVERVEKTAATTSYRLPNE